MRARHNSRPSKAVFTFDYDDATEAVLPQLDDFPDEEALLALDWDDQDSYSSQCRDQFAPVASHEHRFNR